MLIITDFPKEYIKTVFFKRTLIYIKFVAIGYWTSLAIGSTFEPSQSGLEGMYLILLGRDYTLDCVTTFFRSAQCKVESTFSDLLA